MSESCRDEDLLLPSDVPRPKDATSSREEAIARAQGARRQ